MRHNFFIILILLFASCTGAKSDLDVALELAGSNRSELESVLEHYKDEPEKLAAAKFLIENMPAHYSYKDTLIETYYKKALCLFSSQLSPDEQKDTLLLFKKKFCPGLEHKTISDVKIITSDYLIYSIDHAFNLWKTKEWNKPLSFDEFCEWLLPYKVAEKQSFDYWRDTMPKLFSDDLRKLPVDDDEFQTAFKTLETIRNEMYWKQMPHGIYTELPYSMLNSSTMARQTFGRCLDYVVAGVSTFRSFGLPCIIDESPLWGRHRFGHSWYTMISDCGEHLSSEFDISSTVGKAFYPYERIPKVFRNKYAINKERLEYKRKSVSKIAFDLCKYDITNQYVRTSDIEIPAKSKVKQVEDYAYIYCFNGDVTDWTVVDYGSFDGKKAFFKNMGRNILYFVQYFDGQKFCALNDPFILHNDGSIEFIRFDNTSKQDISVRRKYLQKANVAQMRERIKGGKIQASDNKDFSKCEDLYEISDVYISDKILVNPSKPYRYYRYMSADGSYGSIAELAFFDSDSLQLLGKPLANSNADFSAIKNAFDDNYLTNFETENPDGNFVGLEFSKPEKVKYVRIIPRSDDNDIHFGQVYELKYFDGEKWISHEKQTAKDNILTFQNVPKNCLFWIKNHSAGWDERAFLIRDGERVEWW